MTSIHKPLGDNATGPRSFAKVAAIFSMVAMLAAVPSTASARGSIHLDLPHFSVGFHDDGHRSYRKQRKHQRKHYRKHRRNDYNNHRRSYYNKRYYDNGYNTSYRSDRRYRNNYNPPRYSDNYCPTYNYSKNYYRNDGCTPHADHYHCDG